jgi:hypothetical protein
MERVSSGRECKHDGLPARKIAGRSDQRSRAYRREHWDHLSVLTCSARFVPRIAICFPIQQKKRSADSHPATNQEWIDSGRRLARRVRICGRATYSGACCPRLASSCSRTRSEGSGERSRPGSSSSPWRAYGSDRSLQSNGCQQGGLPRSRPF